MKKERAARLIDTLGMVAKDMENDAREFDGKPFTGKTVGEYFGKHGAAIAALAGIMKAMLDDNREEE